jgi:SAM-dependent methyltransferase
MLAVSPVVVLSSDVDWASEACIADTVDMATSFGIRPTFFMTHESRLLEGLGAAGSVELAPHPNFQPGSTHGTNIASVIDHVMALTPAATGFRSHGFVDSSAISQAFKARGMSWDSNLCLYLQDGLVPLCHASGMTRFPVFWEDDVHMEHGGSWNVETVIARFLAPGLKVLDVHPVHFALNTPDMDFYRRHKDVLQGLDAAQIDRLRHPGTGTRTFVLELLNRLRQEGVLFTGFAELMQVSQSGDPDGRSTRLSDGDHRRYWQAAPDDRQRMLKEIYNQRDAADPYATSRDHNQRELEIFAIAEALDGARSDTILDLGCGNGWTLLSLGKRLPGRRLTGVDFAERLIEGAHALLVREREQLKSVPQFHCVDAIAHLDSLAPSSVDCVITERFLLNLPDKATQHATLRKIHDVLAPGGRLLMCEASLDGFRALNALRQGVGLDAIAETSADNVSANRFEDAEIERIATEEIGFRLLGKRGFSFFFAVSRALYPALIAPQPPRFTNPINDLARRIQERLPLAAGLGSNVLWVLGKAEQA